MTTATVNYLRPGMHSVNPYLVSSQGDETAEFIKSALSGEELLRMKAPNGSIMHCELRVGDSVIELAQGGGPYPPGAMALHVYVKDADAVYAKALAAGGESLYPMTDMPYGDREGGVKDTSGNYWFFATHQGPSHVPEGLRDVTPGVLAKDASGLIDFVKRAYGAEESQLVRSPDGTVVHCKLKIGDSVIEISEAHGQWAPMVANIHLYVPDTDAPYEKALAGGGTSQSAPSNTLYGDRAAGIVDAWGNQWWIATYKGVGRDSRSS